MDHRAVRGGGARWPPSVTRRVKSPKYQSSSLIQLNTTNQTGQATSSITFPDPVQLLGSTTVEQNAANILHNPNVGEVTSEVTGTVDPTTGALSITATNSDPAEAQDVAKAYTTAFTNQMQAIAQAQINKINLQIDNVNGQIATLESQQSTREPQPGHHRPDHRTQPDPGYAADGAQHHPAR